MKKFLVTVCGSTATGKTEVSIDIAKHFRTEIISSDARQFYLELSTGTAKPSVEQLAEVPHHFISHLSVHSDYSAGAFEREVIPFINGLFSAHEVVVMVGGSGLFMKAVLEGFDSFPPVDKKVKEYLVRLHEREGLPALQKLLEQYDPVYFKQVDQDNPSRLIRALGVCISSGIPYSSFRKEEKKLRSFIPVKIGLALSKEELQSRIHDRVDRMMANGLVDEAKKMLPYRKLNALLTVGYAELFDFFDGKISLEQAVQQIKLNTMQYAKRQMTWFRKDKDITWFHPSQCREIIAFIEQRMEKLLQQP